MAGVFQNLDFDIKPRFFYFYRIVIEAKHFKNNNEIVKFRSIFLVGRG